MTGLVGACVYSRIFMYVCERGKACERACAYVS